MNTLRPSGRVGRVYDAICFSVVGSNSLRVGVVAPTQTVSIRPRRSKVRLAHSATCSVDVTFGLTPSGPGPG